MRVTLKTPQYVVFDDVFTPEAYRAAGDYFQRDPFRHVHDGGVQGVYHVPEDGNPLIGRAVMWPSMDVSRLVSAAQSTDIGVSIYPTGTAADHLLEAVKAGAQECPDLVGEEGKDWVGIQGTPQAYPPGTGVSWHSDVGPYCGAFIVYLHPYWDIQWGGELMVADPSTYNTFSKVYDTMRRVRFDNDFENEKLMASGIGSYVMPKPNRMVMIASGHPHQIAKVAAAAGNHLRCTFSGFFVTQPGAEMLIGNLKKKLK